jgi:hypothetical protein
MIITLKDDVIATLMMVTMWENDGCNCDYFGIITSFYGDRNSENGDEVVVT